MRFGKAHPSGIRIEPREIARRIADDKEIFACRDEPDGKQWIVSFAGVAAPRLTEALSETNFETVQRLDFQNRFRLRGGRACAEVTETLQGLAHFRTEALALFHLRVDPEFLQLFQ